MKQETLEELAENQSEIQGWGKYEGASEQYAIKSAFINGYQLAQERMYSEEDLKEAFFSGCQSERQIKPRIKCWEQWFEQFKKK